MTLLISSQLLGYSLRINCYLSAVDERGRKQRFQNFDLDFVNGSHHTTHVGPYKVVTSSDSVLLNLEIYANEKPLYKTHYNVVELKNFAPATKFLGETTSVFHPKLSTFVQLDFFCAVEAN